MIIKNKIKIKKSIKEAKRIKKELTIINPKWIDNNKQGRYNFKTPKHLKFYEEKEDFLLIPRGFFYNLEQKNYIDLTKEHSASFIFSGKLKDFQKKAKDAMLKQNIGTLSSPTGSGKTVIALSIIASRQQKTLIVVHTKELLNQWIERIISFLKITRKEIGIIANGKIKICNITVALIQTLRKQNQMPDVGHLVIDECHKTPASTFYQTISKFQCKFILGLSATAFRNDGMEKLIFWYVGPIIHEIKQEEMQQQGHISFFHVKIKETNFSSTQKSDKYSRLITEMTFDEERNLLIVKDVQKEVQKGSVCIVLCDRKKHCRILTSLISSLIPETRILTSDNKDAERKETITDICNGQIKVLVATGSLIGEGFDCPLLSALFLTSPIRFRGRLMQYVGRILRKKEKPAIVYDYFDHNIKFLYGSKRERMKFYKEFALSIEQ